MSRTSLLPLALSLACISAAGTSAPAAVNGLLVKDGGTVIAQVWNGVASGEISVPPSETSPTLEVFWLDQDSLEFQPPAPPHTMDGVLTNPLVASFASTGTWTFEITGLAEDMTGLTLTLLDNAVPIYTSPEIEVHVEEAHAEADGFVLRQNGMDVVSVWQGVATGFVQAYEGFDTEPFDVVFLDLDSLEFQPHVDDGFSLVVQIADTLTAEQTVTGDWQFLVSGVVIGTTTVRVGIFHEDHIDFLGPPIDLHVSSPVAVGDPEAPLYDLRFAGSNPFRVATTLRFALAHSGYVDLALFDVAGRRRLDLVRGTLPAGEHSVRVEGGHLAPGTYIARLVTEGGVHGLRLTVTR
jgi:hypothetical protein